MNIGYLIKFKWHPPAGGPSGHAFQVADKLIKRGHRLHTIYYHHPNPLVTVYRQRELLKFLASIDVLYIRVDGDFGYERFTWFKVLKFMKLPVVWEINSPLEELLTRGKSEEHVRKLHRKRVFWAKFVDAAICVSKENQAYARDVLGIKNTYVIPNGSDPDQFSPSQREPAVYERYPAKLRILWSGSAEYKWHGIDLINSVAAQVYALDKSIVFILIGNEADLRKGRTWTPNVQILKRKDYFEIPKYIASADAGLCLYADQSVNKQFYFSPLKMFDYMASGIAVMATRVGQIAEVIEDGTDGMLVDNDAGKIVQKIMFLRDNLSEAKRMGSNARRKVEKTYNWGKVAEQTESIFMKLNGSGRAS